jgi:hypothetical protein
MTTAEKIIAVEREANKLSSEALYLKADIYAPSNNSSKKIIPIL